MTGKIIKGIAGFYYVCGADERIYECRARGIFRNRKITPLVGDNVEISVLNEEPPEGNINEVLERKNALVRPAAANIDQVLVVFAARDPEPNLNLLDRFLVMLYQADIPVLIAFNKADLVGEGDIDGYRRIYEPAGYRVMSVSTYERRGIDEIRSLMAGKTTAFAGPSGVGKSSLVNLLMPEANMETGDISGKIRRGKHTTRHSQLFRTGRETYMMDTPGFSSIYVEGVEPDQMKDCFPEFSPYEDGCRFPGCVHIGEKACGVKEAVQQGKISRSRYDNYRMFYEEQKDKRRY